VTYSHRLQVFPLGAGGFFRLFVKKNERKTIYLNLIIIYPLDDIPVGMIGVERQGLFFYEVFIEPMRQGRGEILSMEGV